MNEKEALTFFRNAVKNEGGQRAFARKVNVSPAYINDIYHGKRSMGPGVLKTLRLRKKVTVEYEERKA
jgi:DNA-binding transcriptional regulator YdaS (Cro superfamily)